MRWCLDCETGYPDSEAVCPNCGSAFFTDEPISEMPVAKLTGGKTGDGGDGPTWPVGSDGEPVKPAFLETVMSTNPLEYDMQTMLLASNGIPTLRNYPGGGGLAKIILGFAGTGLDLYVPETMLDEAREILKGNKEEL